VRERWFGATGRQVPELALAGDVELAEPVVVRASTPEAIKAALARPEVSCVVVPDDRPELLELDLTELTYG
jgi:hypothetical protein